MKPRTKKQRLLAILDFYRESVSKGSFTIREVCDWTVDVGLYPIPQLNSRPEVQDEWETRFAAVSVGVLENSTED